MTNWRDMFPFYSDDLSRKPWAQGDRVAVTYFSRTRQRALVKHGMLGPVRSDYIQVVGTDGNYVNITRRALLHIYLLEAYNNQRRYEEETMRWRYTHGVPSTNVLFEGDLTWSEAFERQQRWQPRSACPATLWNEVFPHLAPDGPAPSVYARRRLPHDNYDEYVNLQDTLNRIVDDIRREREAEEAEALNRINSAYLETLLPSHITRGVESNDTS